MDKFTKTNKLVAFTDVTGFTKAVEKKSLEAVAQFIAEYYRFIGEVIEQNGGEVIKFIGDAALIVFDEENTDTGVKALVSCKQKIDAWLKKQGLTSQVHIQCHCGEVMYGDFSYSSRVMNDVIGEAVNIAARIKSNGFAMTPQVFRKLSPATRKLFKKHTPPVTYIPLTEYHRD
ncbi:MAG: adenylate/guanylate cyclase domain-containing protein [Spirochaetes bacterium]|nr:adenylate/guanylate cyclase domain-containing protein [Spirochaetota bacterium]